jgi:hypothetical protein
MDEDLKTQIAYMDGEDFLIELQNASCTIYPSKESIEDHHGHSLDECGIVKVEIRFVEWAKPNRWVS